MPAFTHKRPSTVVALAPIPLRTILPLSEPSNSEPPALPSPPRQPSFGDKYELTTHLIPSAQTRTTPDATCPAPPSSGEDRKAAIEQISAEILNNSVSHAQGRLGGEKSVKQLWNCVNCYRRRRMQPDSTNGLTLLFAHANGFPKEIWEPALGFLIHNLETSASGVQVDEIWAWEAVQHGDSALINEPNLSGVFDWSDNTRDILNFLLHYLPSAPVSSPTQLPRLGASESSLRRERGFGRRTLVGVGHSLGGCTTTLAALEASALFSSLILIDPIIEHPNSYGPQTIGRPGGLLMGAVKRRTQWESMEVAHKQLAANPFFAAWHPDVLAAYIAHGLTNDSNGGVRLKMSGIQEATVFAETRTGNEVYARLPTLDPRVELFWVMPGDRPTFTGPDVAHTVSLTQTRVWLRPENSSNVRVMRAGHLVAQEAPEELAREICGFLERKYGIIRKSKL